MSDDFDRLIELLSKKTEKNQKDIDEIFQKTSAFFDHYKEIQLIGNEKQKKECEEKMQLLKEKIKEQRSTTAQRSKLSTEELLQMDQNRMQFSDEQWEFVQKTKKQILAAKEEKKQAEEEAKEKRKKSLKGLKKGSSRASKSSWLKS